jgi:hypothetical protein
LLRCAKHVARFILVALYTGHQGGAVCAASFAPIEGRGWIDLDRGIFYRRPAGQRETRKRRPPVPLPRPQFRRLPAGVRRLCDLVRKAHTMCPRQEKIRRRMCTVKKWEEIMGRTLLEKGDNIMRPGVTLAGTGSLAITFDDTGNMGNTLDFLVLSGTTPVTIDSTGVTLGRNELLQLAETTNNPTKVIIKGSESFLLGNILGLSSNLGDGVVTDIAATAASPKTIHSSLKLIDASATTGGLLILAGATNTSADGLFGNGGSLNANVTITYTGLTIKGGSGDDVIQNDAKNGVVTEGNGMFDRVVLGGSGAKATLGTGAEDHVSVGFSNLGTNEAPGSAIGDKVTFGDAATALLSIGPGAEAGSTAGTASIGLTKVLKAADGMGIDFTSVTTSHFIADETLTSGKDPRGGRECSGERFWRFGRSLLQLQGERILHCDGQR